MSSKGSKSNRHFSRRSLLQYGAAALLSSTVPFGQMGSDHLGGTAFAAPARTPFQPVRFAVFSDLHVDIKGKNGVKMGAVSVECLQRTVADIKQEDNLDFVLVPGDLLLDGELENARVTRDALNRLTVPYYVIAGNHDYRPVNQKYIREGFNYLSIEDFVQFFKGHGFEKEKSLDIESPGKFITKGRTCKPCD